MNKYLLLICILISCKITNAQLTLKPADVSDATIPNWAKEMYGNNPNVFEIDEEFESYIQQNNEVKNRHTAYYSHWRKFVQPYIQENGSIKFPSFQEKENLKQQNAAISAQAKSANQLQTWAFAGPEKNFRVRYNATDTITQISWHANMYCIDQSASNPNVLYAGGENGGVYKTTDKGLHWQYISLAEDMITVTAIAVNPSNDNDVLVTADKQTYRTINGGATWSAANTQLQNKEVHQFVYNPNNTQLIFAGVEDGLYKSTNGGNTWVQVYNGQCQSVAIQPNNTNKIFALRYDAVSKIASFYKSIDGGLTFTIKPTGWFTVPTADAGLIQSYGGRIAVTTADTNRIYVLLVGESQAAAALQLNGQIGIYKSTDGGESWSNPHGTIGPPYNNVSHPNMMTFSGGNDTYTQAYYNTTIVASQLNADKILIGGMSMWQSIDGAANYTPVGGYIGNIELVHPDNQEFKIYKTSANTEEVWFANDGGINYSTDFVQTHESRCNGLYGTAFWGFDQGWNDDIMVGGRYHNGNTARRDGYPQGEYQQLGGGEAPTGYVNYSNEKKTYFSDIDGVVLPDTLNGIAKSFPIAEDPNESYVDNSSSRIMFDWDYWNMAYLGKDNTILKSTNGGSSYSNLHTFGSNANDKIYWFEQSRANTNVMYAQQVINNFSKIWKSTDRGVTWAQITLPQPKRELNFTLSYNNANEFWISYPQGANGSKVYRTINGGTSWANLTTTTLNGYDIKVMAHQFGTDGGVYLASYHGPVFYRNNALNDWQVVGSNLPQISYPLRVIPFYRDNKLRLATWHLGIWENVLYEPSALIADFSANYKAFYCPGDTISFVPHSVSSANATYVWTFTGATPATSTAMYPKVVYNATGSYTVSLMVTDNGVSDTISKTNFITTTPNGVFPLQENFEAGSFNTDWKLQGTGTTPSSWNISNTVGGFGASTKSMLNDNWTYDAQGAHDAVWTAKYDFTNVVNASLNFDVAYAQYGGNYSDTLEILASHDCGNTFTSMYLKGGVQLSTAPQNSAALFVPTTSQWRTDSFDVSSLATYNDVIFSFVNIGRFGQPIYVDNINLSINLTSIKKPANTIAFNVFPNPAKDNLIVTISDPENAIGTIEIIDALGQIILKQQINKQQTEIDLSAVFAGIYNVVYKSETSQTIQKKLVVVR